MPKIPKNEQTRLIGALLDHIRAQHSLTSDDALARWLGVSDTTIWRWRSGRHDPIALLIPLAVEHAEALLGTTPE